MDRPPQIVSVPVSLFPVDLSKMKPQMARALESERVDQEAVEKLEQILGAKK